MNNSSPIVFPPFYERLRPLLVEWPAPVHVVGGAIRDALLGRAIHDLDLVAPTGAIPLTFHLADHLGWPAYALDRERDVGRLILPGEETAIDIACYRGLTLEEDIYGRDFTINALALPAASSVTDDIIDLHNGQADLRHGLVRAIHGHSIADDPVRALRSARLAAQLDFTLTEETVAAVRAAGPSIPERVSPERVRDELSKLLTCGAPDRGVLLARDLGLLPFVLPAVAALEGLAQSPPHRHDVFTHTVRLLHYLTRIERLIDGAPDTAGWNRSVEKLLAPYRAELAAHLARPVNGGSNGRLLLYWGGLLHDIGKRPTQTFDPDGRIRFIGHDAAGAALVGDLMTSLRFSNDAIRHVRQIVAGHMRPLSLASDRAMPSRRASYRYFRALREAGIDVGLLSLVDHLATYEGMGNDGSWDALLAVVSALFSTYYTAYEKVVAPPRLLDGKEIQQLLGILPGREIGRLLSLLEEAQATGQIKTRAEAAEFIRQNHAG